MTHASCPQRMEQVITQKTSADLLLFNMEDGNYYSLNAVGGRIWELCDGSHTVAEIVGILASEYEAPAEMLANDALELLDQLHDGKLIAEARHAETVSD